MEGAWSVLLLQMGLLSFKVKEGEEYLLSGPCVAFEAERSRLRALQDALIGVAPMQAALNR